MEQSTRIYEKTTVLNFFKNNLKITSWQFSWKLGFIGLLLLFTYIPYPFIYLFIYSFIHSFIYLFIYLFIFLSHLFSLLFLTSILPIYHPLSPLSQSILYYLLCIHFVISLCSYFVPTYDTISLFI